MLIGFLYPIMMLGSVLKVNKTDLKEVQNKNTYTPQSFYAINKFSSFNLPRPRVPKIRETILETTATTTTTPTTTTTTVARLRRRKTTTRKVRNLMTKTPWKSSNSFDNNPKSKPRKQVTLNEEMTFTIKPEKAIIRNCSCYFLLVSKT
jgi:hypothetical protein